MADQNQGKGATQGGSPSEKGNQGGAQGNATATSEQGRKDQDRGGAQREDPQAGEPRSKEAGTTGNDPRQDKTRSGMTGGQLGNADATEDQDENDAARTTAGQERPNAAKGNDMTGATGTKDAQRKNAPESDVQADRSNNPNATQGNKGNQGGQR